MPRRLLLAMLMVFVAEFSPAQEVPPSDVPAGMQAVVTEMAFEVPTRIAGRLMTMDPYDEAIWLEWTEVFAEGGWRPVPINRHFVIYPAHKAMMEMLRAMPRGTVVRMTVLRDSDGKRRIVELEGT